MPDIFEKNCKVKLIEYGENCSSFPMWDKLKAKISTYFKK